MKYHIPAKPLALIKLNLQEELADQLAIYEGKADGRLFVRAFNEDSTVLECEVIGINDERFRIEVPKAAADKFVLASKYFFESSNVAHGMMDFTGNNVTDRGRVVVRDGDIPHARFLRNAEDLTKDPENSTPEYMEMQFMEAVDFGQFKNRKGELVVGWRYHRLGIENAKAKNLGKTATATRDYKYLECPEELFLAFNRTSERGKYTFEQIDVEEAITSFLATEQIDGRIKRIWTENLKWMAFAYRFACGDTEAWGELNKLIVAAIPESDAREAARREARKQRAKDHKERIRQERQARHEKLRAKRQEQRAAKEEKKDLPAVEAAPVRAETGKKGGKKPKSATPAAKPKPQVKGKKTLRGGKKATEAADQAQT